MTYNLSTSFFIIGGGRAGASLARYFASRDYRIISLVESDSKRLEFLERRLKWDFLATTIIKEKIQESKIVMLCVQDDSILSTAQHLAEIGILWKDKIVAHTSGIHPARILNPLSKSGAAIASVHPIISFPDNPNDNAYLDKCWFDLEGDDRAVEKFEELFMDTGNKTIRLNESLKMKLHLACVFYANFYVALAMASQEILNDPVFIKKGPSNFLEPLLKSAIHQVYNQTPLSALTGPAKRGDSNTINKHMSYLKKSHSDLVQLYSSMSEYILSNTSLPNKDQNKLKKILFP